MAKPDEKLTQTAILKRIYRVLELEYIRGRHHGVASADVESVARDGVVVMLSKEPVAEIRRLFYVEHFAGGHDRLPNSASTTTPCVFRHSSHVDRAANANTDPRLTTLPLRGVSR